MDELIRIAEAACAQEVPTYPDFKSGDTITVSSRIKEGNKERIQQFTGVVIQVRGEGMNKRFTVLKHARGGIWVERIFPINSPMIAKIEVMKSGKVRRARIYYYRNLKGKSTNLKEKVRRKAN
ncbi:MAG: 50S ribosomal protein L19 [Bacteroides sp.]